MKISSYSLLGGGGGWVGVDKMSSLCVDRAQLETMMSDVWEKNELGRLRSDWQCVAVIVDRTLMIVFTLVFLITILWIYYQFPSHIIHPQHTPAMPNIVIE